MDLKRRLEKLEKEVENLKKGDNGVFILVREFPSNEQEEERIKKHEEELLEKLKDYKNVKIVIAVVEPKGWQFQLPELGIEVRSNGEVHRYKES
jgi:hypothetical protein